MTKKITTKYPVYVPTKGRYENPLTINRLMIDEVPFYAVIEEDEYYHYAQVCGEERLLVLPESGGGNSIYARNWIKDHSIENGAKRHWQLDDNLRAFYRRYKGRRFYCNGNIALRITEDFVDRYTNVAIAGLNYDMFVPEQSKMPPFYLNNHVYSCTLILNEIPHRWRGTYNEDTDMCLQVLSDGWCTILMNAFLCKKVRTMAMKGGNTDLIYQGDGRSKMAHELARRWPGVVEVRRRFGRPQHVIKNAWRQFDTQLEFAPGVTPETIKKESEYHMQIVQMRNEIKSDYLREEMEQSQQEAKQKTKKKRKKGR